MAKRYPNILSVACTPGFARTAIFDKTFEKMGFIKKALIYMTIYPLALIIGRSADEGAQVILHCAMDPTINNGAYYSNCYEKPSTGKDNIS